MKLDLGCGPNKKGPDYIGVDCRPFDGKVDVVLNLGERIERQKEDEFGNFIAFPKFKPWPWEDNTITEVWCSHFFEHLDVPQRIHFVNELFRVMMPGSQATIVTPHWCSTRAYGDLDHKPPVVSEMFYFYLNKEWRTANAPHDDFYTCDFAFPPAIGHAMRPDLHVRNDEYKIWMLQNCKETALDTITTIRKP